jgi:hypothetical protein
MACWARAEITAFESKAHAKNDYFHVGKRGEMPACLPACLPARPTACLRL